ncbi:DUF4239 domain-containing protein [Tardiphaga sp.]|uniref:bestrophin-like domain n=1 Tax=Tardiphaga sp. TaxID=1926292 RepID=UPI00262EF33D|nr:DUF4239 domain-containing protein [Tardiphaga sp.]MDB5621265.1 hypothetical protein [Tardiphaga sp.]
MIRAWLDLPALGIFVTLCALYFGAAVALTRLVFRSPVAGRIQSLAGVVAPFFSAVAILFALLTGFLANDVGERSRQAVRAVQTEAGELRNIYTLSVASVSDMHDIRVALKDYARSAVQDEWPQMIEGGPAATTSTAYDALLREVSDPSITSAASGAVHTALLNSAVRVGTARTDRLSLASDYTNDLKWISVLILGVMTQIALSLVHLERPRALLAALTVFSTASVVALGLIALQEHPFQGTLRVSSAPLERLLVLSDTVSVPDATPAPAAPPAK